MLAQNVRYPRRKAFVVLGLFGERGHIPADLIELEYASLDIRTPCRNAEYTNNIFRVSPVLGKKIVEVK